MAEGVTLCIECHWCPDDYKREPWWRWLCHHPDAALPAWLNPVTGQTVADPPFKRCKEINLGNCPLFSPTEGEVRKLKEPAHAVHA